jgi:hypothetical protein
MLATHSADALERLEVAISSGFSTRFFRIALALFGVAVAALLLLSGTAKAAPGLTRSSWRKSMKTSH